MAAEHQVSNSVASGTDVGFLAGRQLANSGRLLILFVTTPPSEGSVGNSYMPFAIIQKRV